MPVNAPIEPVDQSTCYRSPSIRHDELDLHRPRIDDPEACLRIAFGWRDLPPLDEQVHARHLAGGRRSHGPAGSPPHAARTGATAS